MDIITGKNSKRYEGTETGINLLQTAKTWIGENPNHLLLAAKAASSNALLLGQPDTEVRQAHAWLIAFKEEDTRLKETMVSLIRSGSGIRPEELKGVCQDILSGKTD
jgi:hypothetical protein